MTRQSLRLVHTAGPIRLTPRTARAGPVHKAGPALRVGAILFVAIASLRAQSARTTWDGVYTAAQAARGAALYAQNCAPCHGPALTGADGPPLTGVEFSGNWNALSLGDLFERMRTSMPPDDPGKLTAQDKADVLAHVLSVNGFPAGTAELPRDTQLLTQITFVATRP